MKDSKLPLVISIVLFIIAIFAVKEYIQTMRVETTKKMDYDRVLVAREDIAAGKQLSDANVIVRTINRNDVSQNMFLASEKDRLFSSKQVVNRDIPKGEYIFKTHLYQESSNLPSQLKAGRGAMTLTVNTETGVAWMIRPGSEVDIIGTFEFAEGSGERVRMSTLVLSKVKVLAVDNSIAIDAITEKDKAISSSYSSITVETSYEEAQALTFAREFGQLSCVLRSAGDTTMAPAGEAVDPKNLLEKLKGLDQKRKIQLEANPIQ